MSKVHVIPQSSLEKIFPDAAAFAPEYTAATALRGERISYQLVLKREGWGLKKHSWTLNAPPPITAAVYRVANEPCELAAYPWADRHDEDYLSLTAGLFPDILQPLDGGEVEVSGMQNTTVWVELTVPADCPAGQYPITFTVEGDEPDEVTETTFTLTVIAAELPKQKLLFTQWFHVDCIADYYHVPVYSEEHWQLIEKFLHTAADHGMNMVLTPVLTPSLDTAVGTERPCTQLLEIECDNGQYRFGFAKLTRFVEMALRCGITHFEISHLFTQWGAEFAPNIYVTENGVRSLKFGWHTAADSPEYTDFLQQMIPAVIAFFTEHGLQDRIVFHISDEPSEQHLETYKKNVALVKSLIGNLPSTDALSSYEFYKRGYVDTPVVATDHITPFIEHDTPNLWAYYCCSQGKDVGNRFLSMPSHRNRILGQQLYKFHIAGFLQWGYNFWYRQYSLGLIDPYRVSDGGGAFPGGDPFSVYPGADGTPVCSLRLKVFYDALQDLRALELLESLTDRTTAEATMEDFAALTFANYPRSAASLLATRERINAAIAAAVNKS